MVHPAHSSVLLDEIILNTGRDFALFLMLVLYWGTNIAVAFKPANTVQQFYRSVLQEQVVPNQ